jgi:glucose 1-dehydrogenase
MANLTASAPRLAGKRAFVTGANRGIGRAIALRLATEGADVAVHFGHHEDEADQVAREIEQLGRRATVHGADLSRIEQLSTALAAAHVELGVLDILVNNAGLEKNAPFWEVTEEDYDRVLDVNLKAVFFGTRDFVRALRKAGRPGKVINISSVHEDLPFPNFAPYCAAKGGLRMLTRTLAVELRGTGITVNAIAPGAIETPMNKDLLQDQDKRERLLHQIPLGRLGKPEDVAGVAAFLASADADYVTGATYFVDGGLTHFYEEQ